MSTSTSHHRSFLNPGQWVWCVNIETASTRTQTMPDASEKDVRSKIRRMRPKNAQDASRVHIALCSNTAIHQIPPYCLCARKLNSLIQGCTTFSPLPTALRLFLRITAAIEFKIFLHCFCSAFTPWTWLLPHIRLAHFLSIILIQQTNSSGLSTALIIQILLYMCAAVAT